MRTEKEILKEFEKWGYVIDNNERCCDMEHRHFKKNIYINKSLQMFVSFRQTLRTTKTIINGTEMKTEFVRGLEANPLLVWEFELLHELFTIWGWFDKGE